MRPQLSLANYQVQPALDALKEASLPETAEVQSVLLEIFQEIRQFFAADDHDEMGLVKNVLVGSHQNKGWTRLSVDLNG